MHSRRQSISVENELTKPAHSAATIAPFNIPEIFPQSDPDVARVIKGNALKKMLRSVNAILNDRLQLSQDIKHFIFSMLYIGWVVKR